MTVKINVTWGYNHDETQKTKISSILDKFVSEKKIINVDGTEVTVTLDNQTFIESITYEFVDNISANEFIELLKNFDAPPANIQIVEN